MVKTCANREWVLPKALDTPLSYSEVSQVYTPPFYINAIIVSLVVSEGLAADLFSKESTCNAGRPRLFDPWVGKIPWRRKWQPTPVFLPVRSHGQRSLANYSPWGHEESDMT